ncbi:peptidase [Candidatus Poribacteria bacterium]|nr:peptidase [Candidatus Poribacteria bacterium]
MPGYYRSPTIYGDSLVFASEDDLWTVSPEGGIARRLTSAVGATRAPCFSPDGSLLAMVSSDEGPAEVHVMDAQGGELSRLTYQAANAIVAGWTPDGSGIYYASNGEQPYAHVYHLWTQPVAGGIPQRLPYGPADCISHGPGSRLVLARHGRRDPARWKRYRGGTAGRLWIDAKGDGEFAALAPADGAYATPMWIGDRIYFVCDHEGIGNLYSCLPDGEDLRRHTDHDEYYVRGASTDGSRIAYHAGADLYVYDVASDSGRRVDVDYHSPFTQRRRTFPSSEQYLQGCALHPDGHALAATVRGKPFTMANWEGAALQHGEPDGVRYRLTEWLNDGARTISVTDEGGEEVLEVRAVDGSTEPCRLEGLDIGRPVGIEVSPTDDKILLANHRYEPHVVDLADGESRLVDRSVYGRIRGMSWSPDGKWGAYSFAGSERTACIKIAEIETGETHEVTHREFHDVGPAWDPSGKYLYFVSSRQFNPVYDAVQFGLGFPEAARPFLVTLQEDAPHPFLPRPRALHEDGADKDKQEDKKKDGDDTPANVEEGKSDGAEDKADKKDEKPEPVHIDLDGIQRRVIAFPYPEGRYGAIAGVENKALFVSYPVRGSLPSPGRDGSGPRGTLHVYDFKEQKKDTIVSGIDGFTLSRDTKTLAYRAGPKLRVVKAGEKPDEAAGKEGPSRKSGWIDLGRIRASVDPRAEWRQMYREAWRLQREYFWTEDMSAVDWDRVYERYLPLLGRIGCRSEFSDLMWEMQGELGTSHAYEMGGDYPAGPNYPQGFLGADLGHDAEAGGYRIESIVHGDSWDEASDSPLSRPGVGVRAGDLLVAVGGQAVGEDRAPAVALVNRAGQETEITVKGQADGDEARRVTVKPLGSEYAARYREWVVANRAYVHERTERQVGYVHIPDMGGKGYAEFHRAYLAELDFSALIVDVRHNRGGHVSPLLLEKLARKRIGYDRPRYGQPMPYPGDSVMGPMVALTDENSGSDGDIFSHCFKLMGLGPLIGTRTWGGVIGISPQSAFVDGGGTTQPEYSFWFTDVGWDVENYGTDPDIEVQYRPQDYVAGVDPQMERALVEVLRLLEENPPTMPEFDRRPRLPLPTLPPRQGRMT